MAFQAAEKVPVYLTASACSSICGDYIPNPSTHETREIGAGTLVLHVLIGGRCKVSPANVRVQPISRRVLEVDTINYQHVMGRPAKRRWCYVVKPPPPLADLHGYVLVPQFTEQANPRIVKFAVLVRSGVCAGSHVGEIAERAAQEKGPETISTKQ